MFHYFKLYLPYVSLGTLISVIQENQGTDEARQDATQNKGDQVYQLFREYWKHDKLLPRHFGIKRHGKHGINSTGNHGHADKL